MINFQQVKIDLAFETWVTRDSSKIAFSRQELFQVFLKMWLTRNFDNETLTGIGRYQNVDSRFYHICKNLVSRKILFGFNKTTKGYSFFIKNTSKTFTLEQLTCAIYPYGYLSFLSAMNIYQLSEIKSSAVYYVTYDRTHWKQLAIKEFFQNFKEIGVNFKDSLERFDYLKKEDPEMYKEYFTFRQLVFTDENEYQRYSYQSTIPAYPIEDPFHELFESKDFSKSLIIHTRKKLDEYEWWANVRVQNITDLLIDMMRYPQYCGGFMHVLEVYQKHLDKYLNDLIKRLDNQGTVIDKARFGFVLEKCLGLDLDILKIWKLEQLNKRGGSRKLVSTLEFDSVFDPDWNISINHDEAKKYLAKI